MTASNAARGSSQRKSPTRTVQLTPSDNARRRAARAVSPCNSQPTSVIDRPEGARSRSEACRAASMRNCASPQEGSKTLSSLRRIAHRAMYRAISGGVKKAPRALRAAAESTAASSVAPKAMVPPLLLSDLSISRYSSALHPTRCPIKGTPRKKTKTSGKNPTATAAASPSQA